MRTAKFCYRAEAGFVGQIGLGVPHSDAAKWGMPLERFFRDTTTEQLDCGLITGVPKLIATVDDYIAHHKNPQQTFWTENAPVILQNTVRSINRLRSKQRATLSKYVQVNHKICFEHSPCQRNCIGRSGSCWLQRHAVAFKRLWWRDVQ